MPFGWQEIANAAAQLAVAQAEGARGILEKEGRKRAQTPKYKDVGEAGLEEAISPVDLLSPAIVRGGLKGARVLAQAAARRTASNLVVPYNYNLRPTVDMYINMLHSSHNRLKAGKNVAKAAVKSVVKDKPVWEVFEGETLGPNIYGEYPAAEARRWLLRKGLGSKEPPPAYIMPTRVKGTYSFSKAGVAPRTSQWGEFFRGYPEHPVMGIYQRKLGRHGLTYKDVWDFKLNPGELEKALRNSISRRPNRILVASNARRHLATMPLRVVVDKLMDPVTLAGYVPK